MILALCGCRTSIPKYDGKIWLIDSDKGMLTRVEEDGSRKYSDPKDPQWMAAHVLSESDWTLFVNTYIFGCQVWKSGVQMESASQAAKRLPTIE